MFATLFIQEARTLGPRVAVILGMGVLVIAVALGVAAFGTAVGNGSSLVVTVLAVIAVSMGVFVYLAAAYWQSMHGDRGYFTHTIPATGTQIYFAKTLFAFVVGLVTVVFALLGLVACGVEIAWQQDVSPSQVIGQAVDMWSALPLWIRIGLCVEVLVYLFNMIFPVASIMSIGAQGRWNHLGFGAPIIGFVLLYVANQVAAVIGMFIPIGIDLKTLDLTTRSMGVELVRAINSGSDSTVLGLGTMAMPVLLTLFLMVWGVRSVNRHLSLR